MGLVGEYQLILYSILCLPPSVVLKPDTSIYIGLGDVRNHVS